MRTPRFALLAAVLFTSPIPCLAGLFNGAQWREIPKEEMELTASTVDPDFGAEILYRERKIDDEAVRIGNTLNHAPRLHIKVYERIKIFNEHGIDYVRKYSIRTSKEFAVTDISARVVAADGTITPLKDSDLVEREVSQTGDKRVIEHSFAFPNLRPGCIVEVQYALMSEGQLDWEFFTFGSFLPIRTSRLYLKPCQPFLCFFNYHNVPKGINQVSGGFRMAEVSDIPAETDEPLQPPSISTQPWVSALYMSETDTMQPDKFWKLMSRWLNHWVEHKVDGRNTGLRAKAAELTGNITDPTEKLRVLYDYCRYHVVNTNAHNNGFTEADTRDDDTKYDVNRTFKENKGTSQEIVVLFAAMAKAVGFEVNLAFVNDRTIMDWDPACLHNLNAPDILAAIKQGETWTFYDPGTPQLPFGMLSPGNQGTTAVMANPETATYEKTQQMPSKASRFDRSGTFEIDESGKLSGTATFLFTGYAAFDLRNRWLLLSDKEREDDFKETIRKSLPNAEVSNIHVNHLSEYDKDVEVTFSVEVTEYADVTSDRILVVPSLFEKASKPLFTREKRTIDIRFPYFYETHDRIKIRFPEGFELEEAVAPAVIINNPNFAHIVQVAKAKKGNLIMFARDQKIAVSTIPAAKYTELKGVFDSIAEEDHHVLSFRRIPAAPAETPAPAESASAPAGTTAP